MKYIDAEKAAHKSALGCADSETRKFHEGKDYAYQHVGILIGSLQPEQQKEPDKSLEEEYKDYVENDPVYSKLVNRNAGLSIARHFAEWGAEHLHDTTKMVDKSLEEAAKQFVGYDMDTDDLRDYEVGIQAFIAGANWKEEQVLKKAIDGEIVH